MSREEREGQSEIRFRFRPSRRRPIDIPFTYFHPYMKPKSKFILPSRGLYEAKSQFILPSRRLYEAKSEFILASRRSYEAKSQFIFGFIRPRKSKSQFIFGLHTASKAEIAIHFWLHTASKVEIVIHFGLHTASKVEIAIHFGLHRYSEHAHRRLLYASLIFSSLRIIFVSPINETRELAKVSHFSYPTQMVGQIRHSF